MICLTEIGPWRAPLLRYDRNTMAGSDHNPEGQTSEDETAPTVRVLSPGGDETVVGGARLRIEWESTDNVAVAAHRVQVSLDGGRTYREIAELPGAAQSCVWNVPASTSAERARIKVVARDAAGNLGVGLSPGFFAIKEGDRSGPQVTLLQPKIGARLRGGDEVTIEWVSTDDTGVVSQAVLLSLDGGHSFNALADELPGKAASLRWVVPNLNTTLARLRVVARDGADNLGEETHDGTFSIEIRPDRPALLRV